jgi:hypothetical protein
MNKPQASARVFKPFIFATQDVRSLYGAFVKSCCTQPPFKASWIPESLNTEKRFDTLRALYFAAREGRDISPSFMSVRRCSHAFASEKLPTTTFPSRPS